MVQVLSREVKYFDVCLGAGGAYKGEGRSGKIAWNSILEDFKNHNKESGFYKIQGWAQVGSQLFVL